MARPRMLGLAILALLALPGCAVDDPVDVPTPSETAPAPVPEPAALIVSLDGLELVNDDESLDGSVLFADGEQTRAFLVQALGVEPIETRDQNGYPLSFFEWEGVRLMVVDEASASIWFTAAEAAGLSLRTEEGIAVGMSLEEALSLGAEDSGYDPQGDGASDYLRLDTREAPGTGSLENPGQTGIDYIHLVIEDGRVATIIAPGNDYSDL